MSLADLAAAHVGRLYPGRRIVAVAPFRVTRNANLEVDEESALDLLTAIEDELRHRRRRGDVVRFEVSSRASEELRAVAARGVRPRRRSSSTSSTVPSTCRG